MLWLFLLKQSWQLWLMGYIQFLTHILKIEIFNDLLFAMLNFLFQNLARGDGNQDSYSERSSVSYSHSAANEAPRHSKGSKPSFKSRGKGPENIGIESRTDDGTNSFVPSSQDVRELPPSSLQVEEEIAPDYKEYPEKVNALLLMDSLD